jgi:putative ABC exporter
VAAVAVFFMAIALVGLATGLGARYPRFNAENPSQVAGSYGGVAFMILAVLFMIVLIVLVGWPSSLWLWHRAARMPVSASAGAAMAGCFGTAIAMSLATWWFGMRSGVRALEAMGG